MLSIIISILFSITVIAIDYDGNGIDDSIDNYPNVYTQLGVMAGNQCSNGGTGMSNPASIYCNELNNYIPGGYIYEIVDEYDGQKGICILPDFTECEEWEFLKGMCGPPELSYCGLNGYDYIINADGQNTFTREYLVCINSTTGEPIGAVTDLMNLSEKADSGYIEEEGEGLQMAGASQAGSSSPPPSTFDWTNNGGDWMTPIKNQGSCGSCWAFSAIGVSEAEHNINKNDPTIDLDLSEQALVANCSDAGTCCGGWHHNALRDVRDDRALTETCFPYVDGSDCTCGGDTCDGNCNYNTGDDPWDSCSDATCSDRCANWQTDKKDILNCVVAVSSNRTQIKQHLADKGPLAVAMGIKDSYDGYWDGDIYRCENDSGVNHAVIMSGYNDTGNINTSYWIIRNSWGTGSGLKGYFHLGFGECKVEHYVYFAINDSEPPTEVSNLYSSSHNTSSWSKDNSVDVRWTSATDECDLDGYSILWDTNPGGIPNKTKDIEDWDTFETKTLSDGNNHYFHIRSVDIYGNWDDTAADIGPFYIDTTDPFTTDDASALWYNQNATITLTCTDSGSGCGTTYYCTNTIDSCNPATAGNSVIVSQEGRTYIRYASTDNVGNTETVQSTMVLVDKTAPTTTDNAPTTWQNTNVTLSLTCYDGAGFVSGCNTTYYCVNPLNNPCNPNLIGNSVTISTEGKNYFGYRSKDTANNLEATKNTTVKIDKTPPTTTDNAPSGWNNATVIVNLTATDALSKVATTYYCTDQSNTSPCTPGNTGTSVSVNLEGINYVRYHSVDNAGNSESIKNATVKIDLTKPIADAGPDQIVMKWDVAYFNGSASYDPISNSVASGIANYIWDINNSIKYGALVSHIFNVPKNYTVTLTVIDNAGNSDSDTLLIQVKAKPIATILSIKPNPATRGAINEFKGNGSDEDGYVVEYYWNSSIEGFLSNLSNFSREMVNGSHTINFLVKDNEDYWSNPDISGLDVYLPPNWPMFHKVVENSGVASAAYPTPDQSYGLMWKNNKSAFSSPAIANIDNIWNNGLEIVIGSNDSNVYAFNSSGGLLWNYTTNGSINSTPAIADLDNNLANGLEIVVGSDDGNVYALNSTGDLLWNYTTNNSITSSPAIADIDNDNNLEIAIGSQDNNLYILDKDGNFVCSYLANDNIDSSPAIGDIDTSVAGLEIVFGSDDNNVYVIDNNCNPLASFATLGNVDSSPALGDINNDGLLEIVVGSDDGNVYALLYIPGLPPVLNRLWNFTTNAPVDSSPALKTWETGQWLITVGSDDGNVYALDQTGAQFASSPFPTGAAVDSSPAIVDLNTSLWGPEVVVGSDTSALFAINFFTNPVAISLFYNTKNAIDSSPAIADINHDGDLEIAFASSLYVLHKKPFINIQPHPNPNGPYIINPGQDLILDGSESFDPDEDIGDFIAEYEWDINLDEIYERTGEFVELTWPEIESEVCQGYCVIGQPYPITLRVTDSYGAFDIAMTEIIIEGIENLPQPYLITPDKELVHGDILIWAGEYSGRRDIASALFEYSPDGDEWFEIALDEEGEETLCECELAEEPQGETETAPPPEDVEVEGWNALWDTTGLDEGVYYIKVTFIADDESQGSTIKELYLDPTPPIPDFQLPTESTVSGEVDLIVNIPDENIDNVVFAIAPIPQYYEKNVTNKSQYDFGRGRGTINGSDIGGIYCGPTGAASSFDYWRDHGYINITTNQTELVEEFARLMNVTGFYNATTGRVQGGTTKTDYVRGIREFIRQHNLSLNTTEINNPDFEDYQRELASEREDVLVVIEWHRWNGSAYVPGGRHCIVGNSVNSTRNSATNTSPSWINETHWVDFMDPGKGYIKKLMRDDGFIRYRSGLWAKMINILSVSPIEDEPVAYIDDYGGDGWLFTLDTTELENGYYFVKATANDETENSGSDTILINVYNPVNEPVAYAGPDKTVLVDEEITFDGSASYDPDGEIISYEWDFGDGATDSGEIVTHSYAKSDFYTVTLTVTDNDGNIATDSLFVYVEDKIFMVDIKYDNGDLSLNNVFIKSGFAPDRRIQPETGYRAELYSKTEKILDAFSFDVPSILMHDEPDGDKLTGSLIELTETDFTLIIPYFENSALVNVYYPDESLALSVDVSSLPDYPASNCKTLVNNGLSASLLDIVFVGDNYTTAQLTQFAADVNTHQNTLLSVAPFINQSNTINIHWVNESRNLGCYYNCNGMARLICCNNTAVMNLASQCPTDEIVVLFDSNTYGGSGMRAAGGLSTYAVAYSGIDQNYGASWSGDRVLVHEFGHSFGNLFDEYNGSTVNLNQPNGPNCDLQPCTRWAGMNLTLNCTLGCTYSNWYRGDNGGGDLMRTVTNLNFGPVCQNALNGLLSSYPRPVCNSTIACQCGDILIGSRTLNSSDFNTKCTGDGLEIGASGITLNCNGRTITGNMATGSTGIKNLMFDNVTIKNCIISNFENGIHIHAVSNNLVDNNTISSTTLSTGTAIWVETSTRNNITDNTMSSFKWGFGLDTNSHNNRAEGNTITSCTDGMDIYSSSNNILERNSISTNTNNGILIRVASTNNTLLNNTADLNNWDGLSFDASSTINSVNNNRFCFNNQAASLIYYDINDADANSGDNNTCQSFNNWKDISAAIGCTYPCFVDNPPSITLISPPDNYYNDTHQYVSLNFTANCTDDVGLFYADIYHNYSGVWQADMTQTIFLTGLSQTFGFLMTNLTNKSFIWTVECTDIAGNTAIGTSRTVILNYTAPTYVATFASIALGVNVTVTSSAPIFVNITNTTNPNASVIAANRTIGKFINITANASFISAHISINYTNSTILNHSTLRLYRWNATLNNWTITADSSVNTTSNLIGGNVNDLSIFTGIGELLPDSDQDGIPDISDNCPLYYNPDQEDIEGDTVGDFCDNCIFNFNPEQFDSNQDGYGNICDTDVDNDGNTNLDDYELCFLIIGTIPGDLLWNPDCDFNNDQIVDPWDLMYLADYYGAPPGPSYGLNQDGDGWIDEKDNCPKNYNPDQEDSDFDGIGDICDFEIILKEGWNLISLPLTEDMSVANIFSTISYSKILAYDKKWIELDPTSEFSEKLGYWVKVDIDQILSLAGIPADPMPHFSNGWNLIGYPSLEEIPPESFFDLSGVDIVLMYDEEWLSYDKNKPINTIENLIAGFGYWIHYDEQEYTCCLGNHDESCFRAPISQCISQGGAVMECIPAVSTQVEPPSVDVNYTIINETTYSEWLINLTRDANASLTSNNRNYSAAYDCDDFADDMEQNLTSLGYNATYTLYWWWNGSAYPGHAVTDIHAPDGSLVFIEPQTGEIIDLDFDGDGEVEARHNEHSDSFNPTDDGRDIEVYDDADAAAAAGAPRD